MARLLESNFKAALLETSVSFAFLTKIEFDEGTLAFSSTLHNIEYNSVNYIGGGSFGSVSKLDETETLDPQSYEITLSGIKTAILSAVTNTNWINKPVECLLAILNEDGQLVGTPSIYFEGNISNVSGVMGSNNSLAIVVKDQLALWNTPKRERYTDEDQKARYPGDKGFEFVAELADKVVTWPAKEWFKNNS